MHFSIWVSWVTAKMIQNNFLTWNDFFFSRENFHQNFFKNQVIMEQRILKNVNNCLNTNIYSYLETSGGQSSNLNFNVVHFSTPVLIRQLWQLKTAVFFHRCLICAVLLKLTTARNTNWKGRLCTVDLLIEVTYFVAKVKNVFIIKMSPSILVCTRSTVLSLPLQ
jgi:hypothetical protein